MNIPVSRALISPCVPQVRLQSLSGRLPLLLLLFLTGLLAGCGGGDAQPEAEVSGEVTFEGKPVQAGLVIFEAAQAGHAAQAKIESGNFRVEAPMPPGSYKVSVTPPPAAPPVPGESNPLPEADDIPEKYRTFESSDLKAEISEGDNQLKFELTP